MSGCKLRIVLIANVNGRSAPIFIFERAIDKARPSGNFATGLVSIAGTRYRIGLDTDKQIYPDFPVDGIYNACMKLAYASYAKACKRAGLERHNRNMWAIHGYPMDAIGTQQDWSYSKVAA
jgi:hypothetical protein